MLQKKTLQFLKDIKVHNDRDWFETNRSRYDDAKIDFEQFIHEVLVNLSKFDKTITDLEAKHCTYRQYRDVRFSKDKRPYKINMGAYINRGGKKSLYGGYYFHLEPGNNSFIGGGLWVPQAPELKKVRQEIDYCFDEFNKIVTDKKFNKIYGGLSDNDGMKLKTNPKGYDAENPALEYLKHKSIVAMHPVSDEQLMNKDLIKVTLESYKTLKPLLDFINRSIE